MRTIAFVTLALFATLAAATLLARSPERERRALRHFSADETARGRQFSLERRALFWTRTLVTLALLLWLTLSGAAPRLASLAERISGGRWPLTVLLVGAACFVLQAALEFPFSLYAGLYHQRAWGLTDRSFVSWLGDYAKSLGLSAGIGAVLLVALYAAMRLLPRSWWLAAGAGSALVALFFAFVFPVLIAPLFNRFVPLGETPHASLLPRIRAMADTAGLPVRDVLVMDASRQGRQTNAYFAGFGKTRRIVLYDTLLERHTPEETVSVLAHEMGHWRCHHIVKGLVLGGLGAFAGFFVLAWLLGRAGSSGAFAFRSPSDPASFPLILLLAFVGGFLVAPAENLVSRAFEREADRVALELGGSPEVFIAAEERLVRDNIGNPAPSDLAIVLFASHPAAIERIEMAEAWSARGSHPH
jgi:STE24 endopeptidase